MSVHAYPLICGWLLLCHGESLNSSLQKQNGFTRVIYSCCICVESFWVLYSVTIKE